MKNACNTHRKLVKDIWKTESINVEQKLEKKEKIEKVISILRKKIKNHEFKIDDYSSLRNVNSRVSYILWLELDDFKSLVVDLKRELWIKVVASWIELLVNEILECRWFWVYKVRYNQARVSEMR